LSLRASETVLAEPEVMVVDEVASAIGGTAVPGLWARATVWVNSGRTAVAIRGGAWSLAGYVATQLLRTVATLVLARRFLGPETFGLVGLVAVFVAGLSMFSELGILANVVQHPRGDDPPFLNTAFSIQAGRGLCIWVASLLGAYPLALFYKQPQLFPLLAIAGLSELVRGLTSTAAWTLTRHVKLRNITLLAISAELIASGLAILWAVVSPSAWVLVARTIVSASVYALGSHFIAKPRVHFGWDRSAARDILHFGGWISISTAAYFLGGQGERLILGKFVTPAELGCFSLALMICTLPSAGISQMVNQIFLPMISKTVRTSHSDTVQDFLRARRMFFAVAVVAGLGFLVCSKPLVGLVLNSKYAMTGWMLQLLGLRVAFDVFSAPASNLILACGRTKYSAAGNITRLMFMISGVWIAFALFGLRQAVTALVVAQAVSYFPLIVGIKKLLPEAARSELRWYGALLALLTFGALVAGLGA
jgi:O-antigen/teichoic acid export membrane protein